MSAAFGSILKEWRSRRRFSQMDLALRADLSSRHLSFLESGRATPSRTMILRLAEALEMPKSATNQAFGAAGYAPHFPALPADAPELAPIRAAVEAMLRNHDPLPGVAIDRHWNVIAANSGALRLFAAAERASSAANMVELLLTLGESDIVMNWTDVASLAISRLRAEIAQLGADPVLEGFVARLAAHPRLAGKPSIARDSLVIPLILDAPGARLALFSTIAQFGSVQDAVASELRVELMFPEDAETRAWFEAR